MADITHPSKEFSPVKLSHVVIKTARYESMIAFYKTFL
jgi:hypothetical protein